jgi:hypothetical protein
MGKSFVTFRIHHTVTETDFGAESAVTMAMQVVRDNLWLCDDCLFAAVNGDVTGIEAEDRVAVVWSGLESLGPDLVPDFDSETGDGVREFTTLPCGSCTTKLHGQRHRFAVLGEVAP